MNKQALIYIHVPFCENRGKHLQQGGIIANTETKHQYIEALKKEIDSSASLFTDYVIPAINIGGISPSILRPDDISSLVKYLKKMIRLEKGAEITMKALPHTVGTPSLGGMKAGGVNRISIPMLTADPEELINLQVNFTTQDITNAIRFCEQFRYRNINLDILYGIPGQTEKSMQATLRCALTYFPEHITLCPYSNVEESLHENLFQFAKCYLIEQGFLPYTTMHFAKINRESKYIRKYYEGMNYIGLGLGARSLLDHLTYTNTVNLERYLIHSGNAEQIIDKVETLSLEQKYEYCKKSKQFLTKTNLDS